MNKERGRAWVVALRSGEFEQGDGALCHIRDGGPKYCCLGVASELAAREGVVQRMVSDLAVNYDGKDSYLPAAVAEWLELDQDVLTPNLSRSYDISLPQPYDQRNSLSSLNDSGSSFSYIADLIERHFDLAEETSSV